MKKSKAYEAGRDAGLSKIKDIHLMYQNNTAKNYILGLMSVLLPEYERRIKIVTKK